VLVTSVAIDWLIVVNVVLDELQASGAAEVP